MNRVQLSRKYKSSVQKPLTFVGDPGIRMTFVSYRAIFEIYFAWLGLPLLLFVFEMRRKIESRFRLCLLRLRSRLVESVADDWIIKFIACFKLENVDSFSAVHQ